MPGQKKRKTPVFRFSYSPMPNGLNQGAASQFRGAQPSTPQGRFVKKLEGLPRKGVEAARLLGETKPATFPQTFSQS